MSKLISLSTNRGAFFYSLFQHATMYIKEETIIFKHAYEIIWGKVELPCNENKILVFSGNSQ